MVVPAPDEASVAIFIDALGEVRDGRVAYCPICRF